MPEVGPTDYTYLVVISIVALIVFVLGLLWLRLA